MNYGHLHMALDEFCASRPLAELSIDILPLKHAPYIDLIKYLLSKEVMGVLKDTRIHVLGTSSIHTVYGFTIFGVSVSMWDRVLYPEILRLYGGLECDYLDSVDGQYRTVYMRLDKTNQK